MVILVCFDICSTLLLTRSRHPSGALRLKLARSMQQQSAPRPSKRRDNF
jgi:hypothetical protein